MRRPTKPSDSIIKRAIAYARVSSKEQEKEGFSIAAQQKSIAGYADANGFAVVKEFIDIETAKAAGRTNFEQLIRYIAAHPSTRTVLVEKTDRLYRNLKDWVTLDELDIEIHLVKEGVILSRDSRSSEKFVHGIKVLMAKNYIDNLSEEARKGMQEKAEQGIWPTKAPVGYRNTVGPDGKKIIVPDAKLAPIVAEMFGWYATGAISLKDLSEKAHSAGLVHWRTGAKVAINVIHGMLRHRLYTGEFEWKGHLYQGKHLPLISRELFERVQGVLNARHRSKIRSGKNAFAFSGLVKCGHCGCAMVGEIKKRRYVYYHCTGFKGKCGEPYVREEVLEEQFSHLLGRLEFAPAVLARITKALRESKLDQSREHEAAVKRLREEDDRLQARLNAAYLDKLDGRIDTTMFEKLSAEWREKQRQVRLDLELHHNTDYDYTDEGILMLEMAQHARSLFASQNAFEKKRLLNFVLSNSVWQRGRLAATFREPFAMIDELTAAATAADATKSVSLEEHPVWLGD